MPSRSFPSLFRDRLQKRHRDGADDVLRAASAGEIVHGSGKPLEIRADRLGAAEALRYLVADVARLEIWEYEHVRVALHLPARVLELSDSRDYRRVELHFPVHLDALLREERLRKRDRFLHLFDERPRGGTLGGIRKERHSGFASGQASVRGRGRKRDVDELLRRGIGYHGAIAESEDAIAGSRRRGEVENKAGRGRLYALFRAERVEGGAEHVARGKSDVSELGLDLRRIRELTAAIGKQHLKQFLEPFIPQFPSQKPEDGGNAPGGVPPAKECQLQITVREEYRQEDFATLLWSDNAVHLTDAGVRMLLHVFQKIFIRPVFSALLVQKCFCRFFCLASRPVSDLTPQIQISYAEHACINVVVQSTLTHGYFVSVL